MKRERAMQLAGRVLQGLGEGQDEWPLSLVTELYVFGSLARGAAEPHDVDLDSSTRATTAGARISPPAWHTGATTTA